MCPSHVQQFNRIITESHVDAWINTALCCIASFRQDRPNNHIICRDCCSNEIPSVRDLYENVSRHYLHIGHGELFETCRGCNCVIPRSRLANDCLVCRVALNDFREYLHHSRDRPFDSVEPTIIVISEDRS